MNIVIIDDEPDVAAMLAESLAEEGHSVRSASSAADGLRLIGEFDPDAVFLDIKMPGTTGVEALRQLRQSWPELPVIMMTGFARSADAEECRRLGALDVVQKPPLLRNLGAALGTIRSRPR